jgi:hypothetical protein
MTQFNIWHYLVLGIILIIVALGIYISLKQEKQNIKYSMIFSVSIIGILMIVFSVIAVDKYTKHVSVHKLDSKRILSLEKVVYTGHVRNDGNYPIGKVFLEIKLINKARSTGNVGSGTFFTPSGFFDFFTFKSGEGQASRPQVIVHTFEVARNLPAGASERFHVYFTFPAYFRDVSEFVEVYGR